MLTSEGADSNETIVRPCDNGTWRVEFPTLGGVMIETVGDELEALALARTMRSGAAVRVLPAAELLRTSREGHTSRRDSRVDSD